MLCDAKEVEDNLLACGKFSDQTEDEVLNVEECNENEHDQQDVDLDPCCYKHKADYFMNFPEVFNGDVFVDEHNPLLEEKVVVPIFLVDDIAGVYDLPIYDEYDDDYDNCFQEKPTRLGNFLFQRVNERTRPIYHNYGIEHEESCESAEGNSFPLCFSSFKLLTKYF